MLSAFFRRFVRSCAVIATLALTACGGTGDGAEADAAAASAASLALSSPDPSAFVHALVYVPEGTESTLLTACGGAIRGVPAEDGGGPGWWLVYMPPSFLDQLASQEGLRWKLAPRSALRTSRFSSRVESSARQSPGIEPQAVDGDPCIQIPLTDKFCPYSGTTSATAPLLTCNRSIFTELGDAPTQYGASVATVVDVGVTVQGRTIRGVRLGKQWTGGAPVRQVVIYAAQHGREWVTTELAMRLFRAYAQGLASGNPAITALLSNTAVLIVPVANPDGYEYSHLTDRIWRPNRQPCPTGGLFGTDLNRNFPFSFGQPDPTTACGSSSNSSFRGPSSSSAPETGALINALVGNPSQFRTVVALNLHAHANMLMASEGISASFSPCTTNSNCTPADLGVFHLLAGTERVPRMRDEETNFPYRTQTVFRSLYAAGGDSATETTYGSLGGAPRFVSLSAELTHTECGFRAEELPAGQVDALFAASFRPWADHVTTQAANLASGSVPNFDLPHVHRRQLAGVAGEFPTLRVAVRTPLSGTTLTGVGVAGTAGLDDVLPGVFYREWRWRPTGSPYVFPNSLTVCATGTNCRTARMDAPSSFSLCDSTRFTVGTGWSFVGDAAGGPQDECFWRFTGAGLSPWRFTSTNRDLTQMRQARLIYSYRWDGSRVQSARVIVSANGFVGCSDTNFGNCRVVAQFAVANPSVYDLRTGAYRSEVVDIADFDGKTPVQVRFEVVSSTAPGPQSLDIYDPVMVGWAP